MDVKAGSSVKINATFAGSFLPAKISWCAHVTVAPGNSDVNVFGKGTPHGLNVLILTGGQVEPISIAGDRLAWRNARKNAEENVTSGVVSEVVPGREPCCTVFV